MGSIMQNKPVQQYQQSQLQLNNISQEQARDEVMRQLNQNPNLAAQFKSVMQQYGNMSPWDIAYDLMRRRGIDPTSLGLPRR